MKASRQELSRGIKTSSFNLTANFVQDKESSTFICEAYNDGSRLEKEFKILSHGQFPSLNSLVKVASNFGISLISVELKFRAASDVNENTSCRNEALSSFLYTSEKGEVRRGSLYCIVFGESSKCWSVGYLGSWFCPSSQLLPQVFSVFKRWILCSNHDFVIFRETRNRSLVYSESRDRKSTFYSLPCCYWYKTCHFHLEERQQSLKSL